MSCRVIEGDCLAVLPTIESGSVQTCITSPPYFGLRDYGTATWEGGDAACDHRNTTATRQAKSKASSTLDGATDGCHRSHVARDVCPKCSARRIDDQIGLEPTPDAFVAKMVAVFREVRRVLKDDGTLWLNIGDSYASNWPCNRRNQIGNGSLPNGKREARPQRGIGDGVKDKDLIGIPWMLAKALRDSYYAGRIKSESDRVWLAAMIDTEGCFFIHKRKAGQSNGAGYERKNDTYGSGLEVSNTHVAIVERCLAITGIGSICCQDEGRRQPLYRWNVRSNGCRWIAQEVYPHLVAKQRQARLLIGCPPSGERAEAAHEGLMILHRGGLTDVDFPAPDSLFQPGYYLRQDIIWAKSNPMPESVQDRCTKAHEYLFLLTKSLRYRCNMGAIAEDGSGRVPGNRVPQKGAGVVGFEVRNGLLAAQQKPQTERNKRSVWTIPTQPYPGAHFAVMPEALVTPCVLAGSRPGNLVLDPFCGAGTVGVVADRHDRHFVGIELNPEYAIMARQRIVSVSGPLFTEVS